MENAQILNNGGIVLTEADRPAEAVPLFKQAIEIDPWNPLIWLNLGIAQEKLGDYEEALDSFEHCLVIDDESAAAWGEMGLIYYEQKDYDQAENCYQAALERDERALKTWNNLGVLYFNQGSYENARTCFEEAVFLSPHYYDAIYNLRDACRELKDWRAAAEFERILSGSDNKSVSSQYNRAVPPVIRP
jgi:tetratricopeptide (TPR) repeat protein